MTNSNPNQDNIKATNMKNLSIEERREIARKGAIACNEKKRQRKTMREMLDYLLSKDINTKDGRTVNTQEAILISTIKKAIDGNTNAVAFIRDTIGEKPVDKVEASTTTVTKYITQEEVAETNKHIDEVINGTR